MMIAIPVIEVPTTDDEGNPTVALVPQTPIPTKAISVHCDGLAYTVEMPEPEE